ncbi:MAG: transporter substrate-binding domain-containing protein [Gemmatimonadetes bacterium]|nr:transporter substrate-binding domain-containing protein [Gemmatimonadota bacterium]
MPYAHVRSPCGEPKGDAPAPPAARTRRVPDVSPDARGDRTAPALVPFLPLLLFLLLTPLTACDLPRDPVGTLDRVRGDTLRVGVVAAPPYLVRSGERAGGPEADLIRAFAGRIGAEVEWRWGSLDDHMESLEAFELDLVAGGLTTASPWKKKVGFTRPWRVEGKRKHVLAVPPGENGMLVALEALIEARKERR